MVTVIETGGVREQEMLGVGRISSSDITVYLYVPFNVCLYVASWDSFITWPRMKTVSNSRPFVPATLLFLSRITSWIL